MLEKVQYKVEVKLELEDSVMQLIDFLMGRIEDNVYKTLEPRFEARQIQKGFGDGIEYFMYVLIDHEQPERNEIVPWESAFAICNFSHIHIAMNKFIVESDFWKKYNTR